MDSASEGQPVAILGLRMHVLVAGATFNLNTRVASAAALRTTKE
jgi:cyanophycinase